MTQFVLKSKWVNGTESARDELSATFGNLEITIGKVVVTEFECEKGKLETKLSIPMYYIAEWLAENWWQLLNEPRKSERDDRSDFHARHSLVAAQHGFALPGINIIPMGDVVNVFASRRVVPLANVRFLQSSNVNLDVSTVEKVFADFVQANVDRLEVLRIGGTPLDKAWKRILNTSSEEKQFCQLVGSLGENPYQDDPGLISNIDWVHGHLGTNATRDLCFAATREDIEYYVSQVKHLVDRLALTPTSDLKSLSDIHLPADNRAAPSWRRGVQAAKAIRQRFSYTPFDVSVPDKIFDHLDVLLSRHDTPSDRQENLNFPGFAPVRASVSTSISGLLERGDTDFRLVLSPTHEDQRRFAAARGIYLAWASNASGKRLVTGAVTRNQQASRAFAAELLVPEAFIRNEARNGVLELGAVEEIARMRRSSQEVVRFQAMNNNVRVATQ